MANDYDRGRLAANFSEACASHGANENSRFLSALSEARQGVEAYHQQMIDGVQSLDTSPTAKAGMLNEISNAYGQYYKSRKNSDPTDVKAQTIDDMRSTIQSFKDTAERWGLDQSNPAQSTTRTHFDVENKINALDHASDNLINCRNAPPPAPVQPGARSSGPVVAGLG